MLLKAASSHLLVIDAQERLMPAIAESERVTHNIRTLLQAAQRLEIPATLTEQYPKGLGHTVSPIAETLQPNAAVLPKLTFSAAADPAAAARLTADPARGQIVIAGAEAHVCVLQTALGLIERGLEVFVVGDAVSSRSLASVSAAHARVLHAGGAWVTTEMVLFEWLERAGTEDFRALSALIR